MATAPINAFSSHELRKNRAADRSKKGVVGSKGTKMPMTPHAKNRKPRTKQMYFIFHKGMKKIKKNKRLFRKK